MVSATGKYLLTANMASSYEDIPIDRLEVRVILPEGASGVEVNLPGDEHAELHFANRKTYLDTSGRVVVSFVLENVVPEEVAVRASLSAPRCSPLYVAVHRMCPSRCSTTSARYRCCASPCC